LAPDKDVEKFLDTIDCTKAKVVRGCHAFDVFGMVDVIPTEINVVGREAIRYAIQSVLKIASQNKIRKFVEYETGKPFDGKIGIFVQDYIGQNRGSIIEHPHENGIFRIGRVTPTWISDENVDEEICDETGNAADYFICGRKGEKLKYKKESVFGRNEAQERKKVIELYRKVLDAGLLPSSHSFQMEYGIEEATGEIKFYQARLLRPFEPMADFDINELELGDFYWIARQYGALGVTSPQGLEIMHRAELTKEFIHRWRKEKHVAYAHNNYKNRGTTELDVQPRNLGAYLPYQYQVLEHGHYRWLQKAPVTLIGMGRCFPNKIHTELYQRVQEINEAVRVRIFSDGFQGAIQFVE